MMAASENKWHGSDARKRNREMIKIYSPQLLLFVIVLYQGCATAIVKKALKKRNVRPSKSKKEHGML
jgi:hypothetical protein